MRLLAYLALVVAAEVAVALSYLWLVVVLAWFVILDHAGRFAASIQTTLRKRTHR